MPFVVDAGLHTTRGGIYPGSGGSSTDAPLGLFDDAALVTYCKQIGYGELRGYRTIAGLPARSRPMMRIVVHEVRHDIVTIEPRPGAILKT